ncbi:hypothetical protein Ocin01_15299 [Orchesella cincta]|uniref:CARD domain-containing protein n=1 Tax=Orchesella cincta TaxID=48709 RepID=A0A1D2MES8_ORCCI|nr:hypothetical protein Ocin01_15299 [Orchesella cincta]
MESWQTSHIQKNLNYLTKNTTCNSTFLAILQERNILSDNDYSKLEAKGKSDGKIAQSKLLYDFVTTRKGAYDALIEALRETMQTGSLQVLEQGCDNGIQDCLALQDLEISSNSSQKYNENRTRFNRKTTLDPFPSCSSRISELIPAGREDVTSYIARAFHEGEWVSGKFLTRSDGIHRAYIPYYGKEYEYLDFQVLISPPGATGWVETQPKNIPKLAVVGGFDPAVMEPTYICRVWHDGKLVVGKVLKNSENCFIPYYGKELSISSRF